MGGPRLDHIDDEVLKKHFATPVVADAQMASSISEIYGWPSRDILSRLVALRRRGELPKCNTNRRQMKDISVGRNLGRG